MDIAEERASAKQALAAAEHAMLEQSADPDAFRQAKAQRARAVEDLERLDWAQKQQSELAAKAEREQQLAKLVDAQERARKAKGDAAALIGELTTVLEAFTGLVRRLKAFDGEIERGRLFEQHGVTNGLLARVTIEPGVGIDGDLAVRGMRTAQELTRLSPTTLHMAVVRAQQGKL